MAQQYTDHDMLGALQRAARGEALSRVKYDDRKAEHDPSGVTIMLRFGTWSEACAQAKVSCRAGRETYKRAFTDEDMLQGLRDAAVSLSVPLENLSVVAYRDWAKNRAGYPSEALIRKRLGGWTTAVTAAAAVPA